MSTEILFRGDGGEKYEGPERRKKKTKRTVIDRVKDDISETVRGNILSFLLGHVNAGTEITYKKAPRKCLDTTEFREDIVQSAIGDISIELADEANDVKRTK